MKYVYKSCVGTMLIIRNLRTEKWDIHIGDDVYGSYNSAVAAADDVYMYVTGCGAWDDLDERGDDPTDLLNERSA